MKLNTNILSCKFLMGLHFILSATNSYKTQNPTLTTQKLHVKAEMYIFCMGVLLMI
jgi:hypothetical protein